TVDGQKKWSVNIIIGPDSSNKEIFRVLASNDLSNILLYKKNGDDNIFYAEKIDSSGNIEWSDIIITNDAGGEVSVISDGNGGMVVIWLREYYEGIFAQQISKDGNLGDMVNSVRSKYLSKTPNVFEINHNYPNPFNSSTIIEFNIPRPGKITFNVYTVLGEMIYSKETLFNFPGKNSIQWNSKTTNGKEVNSGIYYFEITFAGMRQTNKAVLIK
ncbi:MAG: T9SS type A sorting domain-containing protein, partial [Bacteroidetes bacterium]|nr:T9SS type A sorting domain-containing protein [Bacteroidota bacterium]